MHACKQLLALSRYVCSNIEFSGISKYLYLREVGLILFRTVVHVVFSTHVTSCSDFITLPMYLKKS